MTYEIYGPYTSIAGARKAIDILGLEGVKTDHIFVFANEEVLNKLKDRADAQMESNEATELTENASLINKIKNYFSNKTSDSTKNTQEKLRDFGIADRQIETYMANIAAGEILVVADNNKRMGNDPTEDTTAMEVPAIEHE